MDVTAAATLPPARRWARIVSENRPIEIVASLFDPKKTTPHAPFNHQWMRFQVFQNPFGRILGAPVLSGGVSVEGGVDVVWAAAELDPV
jgi:hypothetical protein